MEVEKENEIVVNKLTNDMKIEKDIESEKNKFNVSIEGNKEN